jgi:hypothetical protein
MQGRAGGWVAGVPPAIAAEEDVVSPRLVPHVGRHVALDASAGQE